MTVIRGRGGWHAIRFAILVVATLLVSHDAVYAVRFGFGDGFAAGMAATGHGYWAGFTVTGLLAAVALVSGSLLTLRRLEARLVRSDAGQADRSHEGTYAGELARLWPRLLVAVCAAYLAQEALEHLVAFGHVPTLEELATIGSPVTIVILGAVTFVVAALGSLVRWRIVVLRDRLGAGRVRRPRLVHRLPRVARRWAIAAALHRHAFLLVRLDAGRAPPPPARV
ncbi:MAG TPA: hypothetical protein VGK63_11150 [Candidatus Limnocylindrales bacterium]